MDKETLKRGDHVLVPGWGRGVVFTFVGHPIKYDAPHWDEECECEVIDEEGYEDTERAVVVMVGDDTKHIEYVDDLTAYAKPVCSCGQIGCGWHGQDEDEE